MRMSWSDVSVFVRMYEGVCEDVRGNVSKCVW